MVEDENIKTTVSPFAIREGEIKKFSDIPTIKIHGGDDEALEEARLKLQASLEDLDRRIPEEYEKVYWHGLWRRKQK